MTSFDSLSERESAVSRLVLDLQRDICDECERIQGARFREDRWELGGERSDDGVRGWGITRVVSDNAVFEKGGVNVSVVRGERLPPTVVAQRPELLAHRFFAAGVSVVLHPRNPYAPTAHCNYRFFQTVAPDGSSGVFWFGGGADLTPYYPKIDDVQHFHRTLKAACDRHDPRYYPAFKAWCDRYFYLRHRGETRGVGGIFYDYLDEDGFGESDERTAHGATRSFDELHAFMHDAGYAFIEAYMPIVESHALEAFGERERSFQLLRRGRYVEFNLVYDRGTLFGLQSGGRIESILMSLPPLARWAYDERPEPGSPEAALAAFLQPRDWLAANPLESTQRGTPK